MVFKFYVQMDGETFGPYSVRELMGLGLLDDTLITEESMNGEWHQASEFDFEDLLRKEESSSRTTSSNITQQTSSSSSFFKWILILVTILLVFVGVAYIFNSSTSDTRPIHVNPITKPVNPEPVPTPKQNTEPTSQKVMCPMCSGRGFTEPMPGDIMSANLRQTCTGCSGTGLVSQEKFAELSKMMQDVNKMINPSPNPSPTQKYDKSACWNCNGTGKCSMCNGIGHLQYDDGSWYKCDICHQSGKCTACHGTGHI